MNTQLIFSDYLGLDGHLTLSVNFVNNVWLRCFRVASLDEAKIVYPPLSVSLEIEFGDQIESYARDGAVVLFPAHEVLLPTQVLPGVYSGGVWDLSMIGAEYVDIEHRYLNQLFSAISANDIDYRGVFLSSKNLNEAAEYYQLQDMKKGAANLTEAASPALRIPDEGMIVVRTDALREFEQSLAEEESQPTFKEVDGKSKNAYLSIIGALLGLALDKTDQNGKRFASFINQQSIIDAIRDNFGTEGGLSESNLHKKFSAANKEINSK